MRFQLSSAIQMIFYTVADAGEGANILNPMGCDAHSYVKEKMPVSKY